jgi:hypothetical protein
MEDSSEIDHKVGLEPDSSWLWQMEFECETSEESTNGLRYDMYPT